MGQVYVKAMEPLEGQVTFDEVAQQHFAFEDGRVAKGRKLAYTQQRNRREYELHIKPSFGSPAFLPSTTTTSNNGSNCRPATARHPSVRNRHGVFFPG